MVRQTSMRRRFLVTSILLSALVAVSLSTVLVVNASIDILAIQQRTVDTAANALSVILVEQLDRGGAAKPSIPESAITTVDAHASVVLPDGSVREFGRAQDGPVFTSQLITTVNGGQITVNVEKSKSSSLRGIFALTVFTILLSFIAVGAAAWMASRLVGRLVAPLDELARTAETLGSGDARPSGRRYGIPELDRVAEVLDIGVARTNALLEEERQFAADVSHQLRTPLTALLLRLEEIQELTQTSEVRAEASAAVEQIERLVTVVEDLTALHSDARPGPTGPLTIDDLVGSQLSEWEPAFAAANRKLASSGTAGLIAHATRGAQTQVLATLLENALAHGEGTVTVSARAATDGWLIIDVTDQGNGVPEEMGDRIFQRGISGTPGHSGLGLALARTLVSADGGRLELRSFKPTTFSIFLPSESLTDAVD